MIHILPEKKKECCGCHACAQICPQQCIVMEKDEEGFSYPKAETDKCIHCNLCESVCPIIRKKSAPAAKETCTPKAIGGFHKSDEVRMESSSGGAFALFAEYILQEGGMVIGCALKEDFSAEHIVVENSEDLKKLKGSKYIQSDSNDVYRKVKEGLSNGRKVLFTGTPCQCAGLHGFLNPGDCVSKSYENLYVCDFICHGVPSVKVFQSYIRHLEEKYQDKVTAFRFRNKDKGWNPTGLQMGTEIEFLHGEKRRLAPAFKDAYMNGFLDDLYLRPSCYACEFKEIPKDYADITIADFWGVKKADRELYDGKGTSLVLLHTKHGQELFDAVKENFFYKEVAFEKAVRKNRSLLHSASPNPLREKFFFDYAGKPFQKVAKTYMNAFSWAFHKGMKIIFSCIEKIVRALGTPVLKLLHINWGEKEWKNLFQFISFAMVGVSNVAVSYTINISTLFLLRHFQWSFDYVIANVTAFALSVLWSYHWNSRYVFHPDRKEKGWWLKALIKTYISYAFSGIILNNVLATLWIRVLGISKYLSPLLNLPFSMPVNFLMQKLWAYKEKENSHE